MCIFSCDQGWRWWCERNRVFARCNRRDNNMRACVYPGDLTSYSRETSDRQANHSPHEAIVRPIRDSSSARSNGSNRALLGGCCTRAPPPILSLSLSLSARRCTLPLLHRCISIRHFESVVVPLLKWPAAAVRCDRQREFLSRRIFFRASSFGFHSLCADRSKSISALIRVFLAVYQPIPGSRFRRIEL